MNFGSTVLRAAIFIAAGSSIILLLQIAPNALTDAANGIIFWEHNPAYKLYELVALMVSGLLLLQFFAERSIRNRSTASKELK